MNIETTSALVSSLRDVSTDLKTSTVLISSLRDTAADIVTSSIMLSSLRDVTEIPPEVRNYLSSSIVQFS